MRSLTLDEVNAISGAGHYADTWGFYGSYVGNGVGSTLGWNGAGDLFKGVGGGFWGTLGTYTLGSAAMVCAGAAGAAAGYILGNTAGLAVDAVIYLQNRERR